MPMPMLRAREEHGCQEITWLGEHDEAENSTSSSSETLHSNGHDLNNDNEVLFAVALHLAHVTPHEGHRDHATLVECLLG